VGDAAFHLLNRRDRVDHAGGSSHEAKGLTVDACEAADFPDCCPSSAWGKPRSLEGSKRAGDAAINEDELAGHEAAGVAGKKYGRADQLFNMAPPLERRAAG
jgi:hypothetical protein